MTSATELQTERHLLRWSGILLLVGIVLTAAVTMLLHPSGDEDVHEAIFAEYAASDSWEWVHLAQFVGVLLALGGLVVLHQALRPRAPTLSTFAAGLTVATAAVWALLQAVDGITLKQAADAGAAAAGPPRGGGARGGGRRGPRRGRGRRLGPAAGRRRDHPEAGGRCLGRRRRVRQGGP